MASVSSKRSKQLIFLIVLFFIVASLQYTFWRGENSYKSLKETQALIEAEDATIEVLQQRNNLLKAEVVDLKTVGESMEERARMELGYVKEGEVFYRVVETETAKTSSNPIVEPSE